MNDESEVLTVSLLFYYLLYFIYSYFFTVLVKMESLMVSKLKKVQLKMSYQVGILQRETLEWSMCSSLSSNSTILANDNRCEQCNEPIRIEGKGGGKMRMRTVSLSFPSHFALINAFPGYIASWQREEISEDWVRVDACGVSLLCKYVYSPQKNYLKLKLKLNMNEIQFGCTLVRPKTQPN